MLQNYSRYRVLEQFFDFPRRHFHVRELSRMTKLAQISVINHLKALQKEHLLVKEKHGLYPTYLANREDEQFKLLKQQHILLQLQQSGLLPFLEGKLQPNCIVLFGSAARGEDTETSDVDLFIQAGEMELDLRKYEKLLKRRIALLYEPDSARLSKELLNNILNGIIVYGYLKVL